MTSNLSKLRPLTRLGAISFVNTVPIYSDYRPLPGIELVYDVPARLNAMMLAGELDISPVSSACYLRNRDQLVLLDDLSVSSPGAVESVLYLSRKPMGPDMLDMPVISVPNDSETSVMLLAYFLREATGYDLRPWFRVYQAAEYQQALTATDNALIIGDNALMIRESRLSQAETLDGYYCYDLSTLWKEETGLPFVFAVWVANREWANLNPVALQDVNEALRASRNRFFGNPSIFRQGMHMAQERSRLPEATLERYYRHCLTYHLDTDHHVSLERFEGIIQTAANWENVACERQSAS